MSPRSNRKTKTWSAVNFTKTRDLHVLQTWARHMVTWYWSADNLFWQVSFDRSRDVEYQRSTRWTKVVCLSTFCQPSLAAMLRDSVVVVVVVVVRTRPRTTLLAMITMRKSFIGFLFFPVMTMGSAITVITIMQKLPYMILKFILDNQLENARTASSIFCPFHLSELWIIGKILFTLS